MAKSSQTQSLLPKFIEPVLCHSLPNKPTCLAYDSVNNLLAIGCDNGTLFLLSNKQREIKRYFHAEEKCVKLMSFNARPTKQEGKTEHQSYLLTAVADCTSIFLWTVTVNGTDALLEVSPLCRDLKEIPSVFEWSPVTSTRCYIGTKAGNVFSYDTKDKQIEKIIDLEEQADNGEVVKILRKQSKQQLIVIYSNRVLSILWDKKGDKKEEIITTEDQETSIAAWFGQNENSLIVGCSNGQLYGIDCSKKLEKKTISKSLVEPIQNLQRIHRMHKENAQWVAYCQSSTLYFEVLKISSDVFNLKPSQDAYMVGDVIDFEFLSQETNTPDLAVLTESELLFYSKEMKSTLNPSVTQSHHYSYITSPVTYLQHCGMCTKEFLESFPSIQLKDFATQIELIVTGHADGSFRLWNCSYDKHQKVLEFEVSRLVYTADYFSQLDKQMQEIALIKMDRKQENLLIVNKCNRVLLFSCKKQGRAEAVPRPQSHEIILKDYEDTSPSTEASKTPSPHFSPPSTNHSLQLLQHFSCLYHEKLGKDEMDSVPVKCVEYDETLGMLAVGTDRGLVVLDTHKNMLIQVIGSDNKLIKICTEGTSTKKADKRSCKVTCLETAYMILNSEEQFTLWVGTDSGVIACLIITREDDKPLQLSGSATGIFRKKVEGGRVCGIHFHMVTRQPGSREESSTACTNVLVSTEERITVIDCSDISSGKDKTNKITGGVVKSDLFKFEGSLSTDPTHLVSLTKVGTLVVQKLLDQGLSTKEDQTTISKTSVELFASCGDSHCVIKCTDSTGPQLMYFEDNDQTEQSSVHVINN